MKCTPKYNQETRNLKRILAEKIRLNEDSKSGDFGPSIRAKAHDLIDQGLPAKDVLAQTHAFINEVVPHSEKEVLAEINKPRPAPTKSEAMQQRAAIRAELKDLEVIAKNAVADPADVGNKTGKEVTQEQKIATRERALENEIHNLNNGIERKQNEPLQSDKIKGLVSERDKLKSGLQAEDGTVKNPDLAEQARVKARIAEIDRQLAGGELPGKRQGADSEAVSKLKAERDAKQAELDASRKTRQPTEEDRKVAVLEKQLAALLENKPREGKQADRPDTERVAEARAKLEEARKARDLANKKPPADPNETYNKTRQTVLNKRLAEIDRRIREQDFATPEKKAKPTATDKTMSLEGQLNQKKNQFEALKERQRLRNRSLPRKIADLITDIDLAGIFTSPMVIWKLLDAVVARHVSTIGQMAIMSVARRSATIRKFADAAPRHGAGLSWNNLKVYFGGKEIGDEHFGGAQGVLPGMLRQWNTGKNIHEANWGGKGGTSDEFAGYVGTLHEAIEEGDYWHGAKVILSKPGRTHSMIKELEVQPEFGLAYHLQSEHMHNGLLKQGVSEKDAADVVNSEWAKALNAGKALSAEWEAKNQDPVALSQEITRFLGNIDRKGSGYSIMVFLFKNYFKVRNIFVSILKEGTSLHVGGIKAAWRAHGVGENFDEADAEYISKNITKNGVGLTLWALGVFYAANFGAIPGAGKKDKNPDIKPGEANIGGVDIPKDTFHSAVGSQMQLGAGVWNLYKKQYKKDGTVKGLLESAFDNYSSFVRNTVPYIDQPLRTYATVQRNTDGRGKYQALGDWVRGMFVPQYLQQRARGTDPFDGYRYPRSIAEDIKLGIPGQRETVPRTKDAPP